MRGALLAVVLAACAGAPPRPPEASPRPGDSTARADSPGSLTPTTTPTTTTTTTTPTTLDDELLGDAAGIPFAVAEHQDGAYVTRVERAADRIRTCTRHGSQTGTWLCGTRITRGVRFRIEAIDDRSGYARVRRGLPHDALGRCTPRRATTGTSRAILEISPEGVPRVAAPGGLGVAAVDACVARTLAALRFARAARSTRVSLAIELWRAAE